MKRSVAWMARNHVAANLLMVFVLLTGALGVLRMKKETFPEIDLDRIQVQVPYPGASPADVESGVVRRIEERLTGLEGIRRINSTAAEGIAAVTVELELGADMERVVDDVRGTIDRIDTLPAETEKPVIKELVRRTRVIDVVLFGEVPERALKAAAEGVRDDLRLSGKVSQVELVGVRTDEIAIEVPEAALQRHGLTLGAVAEAVRRTSLDLPGGSVKGERGEVLVRTKGLLYDGREYDGVVVQTRPDGTSLTVGHIGRVVDGFEDSDLICRFQGRPAAVVGVYRTGDESALEISRHVREYVEDRRGSLPAGIDISYVRDDARLLRSRLDLLLRNAQLGLALVFVCLSLFLDMRLAFWVMMGIPISFLGSFLLIEPFDVSINMLSLFAFILALGIVVDDAVVVGENIFSHRELGKGRVQAAVDGTLEVGKPVVFTILTSVAAFLPLAFVEGNMGKFIVVIPVIVISVLLLSLVEALYILPAHLSMAPGLPSRILGWALSGPVRLHRRISERVNAGLRWVIERCYTPAVRRALVSPFVTIATGLSLLLATAGYIAGGHIKFVFMPEIDSDWVTIAVEMPQGSTAGQTRDVVRRIETAAMGVRDEIDARQPEEPSIYRNLFSIIGDQPMLRRTAFDAVGGLGGQAHLAEITIELLPAEERRLTSTGIVTRIRSAVGPLPGPESVVYRSSLFTVGNAIEIQLSAEDLGLLAAGAERLKEEIGGYPGTEEIRDSFQEGKLEMRLDLKPRGRVLGLTMADLATQVRHGFYGAEALRLQRGSDDARVVVRYPEAERRNPADIEGMRVRTPSGGEVPLPYVADVSLDYGYSTLQRSGGRRVVTVTAGVDAGVANADEINRDLQERFLPLLAREFPGLRYSYEGEQREQAESFASLRRGFLVALVAIYALLAIPFRSYTQPLVVMSAIPFGMIGAVWGHVLMGLDLAMLSLFGVVALSGVVVNDSLILLAFYNQLRAAGRPRDEALVEAGRQRFRPILLTSATTFFALLPMILERSLQAQFLIPMAVSLAFGILFATVIILIGVPAGMKLLDLLLEGWARLRGPPEEASKAAAM